MAVRCGWTGLPSRAARRPRLRPHHARARFDNAAQRCCRDPWWTAGFGPLSCVTGRMRAVRGRPLVHRITARPRRARVICRRDAALSRHTARSRLAGRLRAGPAPARAARCHGAISPRAAGRGVAGRTLRALVRLRPRFVQHQHQGARRRHLVHAGWLDATQYRLGWRARGGWPPGSPK